MTYNKDKDEVKRMKAKYILNRNELIKKLKGHRAILEKVALEGATTEEEMRMARTACSILASDLYYEDSVMDDKTGITNQRDQMDEFLDKLGEEEEPKKNVDDFLDDVGNN